MNYLKVYCNLIRKAENRTTLPEGYKEKHHTFPISIYGKNDRTVVLSGREHYIAHALLEKVCIKRYGMRDKRTKKMIYAHFLMKDGKRYYNSYLYENVRSRVKEISKGRPKKGIPHTEETKRKISQAKKGKKPTEEIRKKQSERMKGENNPNYGKTTSEEIKRKISNATKGRIPWNKGISLLTENSKKKLKENNKGRILWNKGIPHKEETKRKISNTKTGKPSPHKGKKLFSDEARMMMSESRKGLYNGDKNPRAKTWKITFEDGRIEIVKSLQTWAKERGYVPTSVRSLYNGSGNKKHKDIVSVEEVAHTTANVDKSDVL